MFWAIAFLFWPTLLLPMRWQYSLGRGLGRIVRRTVAKRRKVVDLNLELCFPALSVAERNQICQDCFDSLGEMFIECANLFCGRGHVLLPRTKVHDLPILQEAIDERRGVLLIGMHMNSMEAAAYALAKQGNVQFSAVAREQRLRVLNYLALRFRRQSFGNTNIFELRHVRQAIGTFYERKLNLWWAADQDLGHRRSVRAPFFGVDSATVTSPSQILRLGKRYGGVPPAVLMSHYRDKKTQTIHVHFDRVRDFPSDDNVADATLLNQLIEEKVRAHPEQYYWVHRRFKTLPEKGATRNYWN